MRVSVFLVSDSTIVACAMAQAIRTEFAQVSHSPSFSSVADLVIDWDDTVVIIDAVNPKELVAQLNRDNDAVDTSHIIVLMRANQSVDEYRSIIGKVGALLPDGASLQEIALAARIVRHGITLLPTVAVAGLGHSGVADDMNARALEGCSFTDREHAVLGLISKGASNKVIGRKLDITESTVRVHVRAILKKLGMQNRTQAALYAVGQKGMQVGSDLFRPATTVMSAICGFVAVNLRTFMPEFTQTLLLQASIIA